jgi:hypothetical protein
MIIEESRRELTLTCELFYAKIVTHVIGAKCYINRRKS